MSLKLLNAAQIKQYFTSPQTVSTWWDPLGGKYRYHFENMLRVVESFQLPLQNAKVLDVGPGRGLFTLSYAGMGANVTAADISSEMLDICRENAKRLNLDNQIQFLQDDAETLTQCPDEAFDLVSCMCTFDHIPDLDKAVEAMSRKCRPGGYFVFTYCPYQSLHGRIFKFYSKFLYKLHRLSDSEGLVAQMYHTQDIDRICSAHNIRIEKKVGVGLLCLLLRPQFERGILSAIPRWFSRIEEYIHPFYTSRYLSHRCQIIIGLGKKC